MKTIEEARAEAAQYATQGFTLTEHMSIALADEPMSAMLVAPHFVQSQGAWYAGSLQFPSLRDALAACEAVNDGRLGRMHAAASRAARGAAEPDRRPDVGFGAKHVAARAVVDSLPAGRPPVDPQEHAALREAYERVRAVAAAAWSFWEATGVDPYLRGRSLAVFEDAVGRLHHGDLEPWGSLPAIEAAQDAQALAEAHGPHCPAWCPERGKVDRTVSLGEVKATLDAAPPEDLLDATKVPS